MGLSIKNEELERDVRELAALKGLGITRVLQRVVAKELAWEKRSPTTDWEQRLRDIELIQQRSRALPVIDPRSDDEILGYGDDGLPE
jgi:antitoxin VapB